MAEKASLPQGHILIPWVDSTLLAVLIRSGRSGSEVPGHFFCPFHKNIKFLYIRIAGGFSSSGSPVLFDRGAQPLRGSGRAFP